MVIGDELHYSDAQEAFTNETFLRFYVKDAVFVDEATIERQQLATSNCKRVRGCIEMRAVSFRIP